MLKELIIEAFNKAELARIKQGDKKPSLVSSAEGISDYINSEEGFLLGERSFRDYRNEALRLIKSNDDINIKQLKVIVGLCRYIGYNTYEDFASRNDFKKEVNSIKTIAKTNVSSIETNVYNWLSIFLAKHKTTLIVSFLLLIGFVVFQFINKQRWIVLENNRYLEAQFNANKYSIEELGVYNENLIKEFNDVEPNREAVFFETQGKMRIWYRENSKKELVYYTTLGFYPENMKRIRP